MLLKDMMSKDVPFLLKDDNIEKSAHFFRNSTLDLLPVVEEDMRLVGVFTRKNLIDAILKRASLEDPITPFYITTPFSALWDTPYEEVKEIVKTSKIGTAPVVDDDGRLCGILSKTNMVMVLLKRSELVNAQLKATLNAMHNAVVAVDKNKEVTLLNQSAERLLKLSGESCLGLPALDILPGIGLDQALAGTAVVGYKYKLGNTTIIANILPISRSGVIDGAVIVMQDLTEFEQVAHELETVKELNRTLETVLNIITDGLVVVDRDGVISLVNREIADYLNTPVEDLPGRHVTKVFKNSRLHLVANTGVPELSEIMSVGNDQLIVSRLPIIKNGKPVGAVGKIIFPYRSEIKELVRKLNSLQSKVAYYEDELKKVAKEGFSVNDIVARSPSMLRVLSEAKQVSMGSSTVLITGESGTGKELIARAVHYYGDRRKGPFIMVNCAAIPDNLLESELFGYVPGAFTGADRNGKPGRFEMADNGTIFLDEIGDMSLNLQAKLLRVLQERSFERLGSTKTIKVNVRIISATNKDLEKAIKEKTFREDLFYRLNVINLRLPPLRDRREDIEPLVNSIINRLNRIVKIPISGIPEEALEILIKYHWPGNVRELENVLERAANFASEGQIKPSHLPPYLTMAEAADPDVVEKDAGDTLVKKVRHAEREAIIKALEKTGGNKSKAAKLLKMSRSRLYVKMERLNIDDFKLP